MIKNQSAVIPFFVYNPTSGAGVTGVSSTLTVKISKDGGALATTENTPTELDSANAPGRYNITLTDSEMNADAIRLIISHSTAKATDVVITTETASSFPSASTIATALLNTVLSTYNTTGTVGKKLLDIPTATYTIPNDYALASSVTALSTKVDTVDSVVDAIKSKTDNLPSSPSATGAAMTLTSTTVDSIRASLASSSDVLSLSSNISAILTSTNRIPQSPAASSDIPSAISIADSVLSRNVINIETSAGKYSLCSLIYAALHSSIAGNAWTLKKSDGSQYLVFEVTSNENAKPITGIE